MIKKDDLKNDLFGLCNHIITEFTSYYDSIDSNSNYFVGYPKAVLRETGLQLELNEQRLPIDILFHNFIEIFSQNQFYVSMNSYVITSIAKFKIKGKLLLGTSVVEFNEINFLNNFLFRILEGVNFHKNLDNTSIKDLIDEFTDFIETGNLNIKYLLFVGNINVDKKYGLNIDVAIDKFNQFQVNYFGNSRYNKGSDGVFNNLHQYTKPFISVEKFININDLLYDYNSQSETLKNLNLEINKVHEYIQIINLACNSKIYPISRHVPLNTGHNFMITINHLSVVNLHCVK